MKNLILAILFKYKINNITLIAIQLPDLSFVALNYQSLGRRLKILVSVVRFRPYLQYRVRSPYGAAPRSRRVGPGRGQVSLQGHHQTTVGAPGKGYGKMNSRTARPEDRAVPDAVYSITSNRP